MTLKQSFLNYLILLFFFSSGLNGEGQAGFTEEQLYAYLHFNRPFDALNYAILHCEPLNLREMVD